MVTSVRLTSISLLLLSIVLGHATMAEAGASPFWKELGGSAHGNGLSQTPPPAAALSPSAALGPDGRPVVVYVEDPGGALGSGTGTIVVKRWTGSAWQTLSGADGIGSGGGPQIQIAPSGTIYVAWLQVDADMFQLHLRRRTPTSGVWESIGGSDEPGGVSALPDGAGDFGLGVTDDGNPIVAFGSTARTGTFPPIAGVIDGSGQVYVKRYSVTNGWEYVGSDPFTGGGASNVRSFVAGGHYDRHDAEGATLTVDSSGAPVVAFSYGHFFAFNRDIFVTRWNGSVWTPVGPAVPEADDGLVARGAPGGITLTDGISRSAAIAPGSAGELWLAWHEIPPGSQDSYVLVRRWNGAAWEEIGGSGSGTGISAPNLFNSPPRIAVDDDGAAVVTWYAQPHDENPSQIVVKRAGTSFVEMGLGAGQGDGISAAVVGAFNPALATAPGATPVVAWENYRDFNGSPGQVFLRQFSSVQLSVGVTGDGQVTSTPAGIACPDASCSQSFPGGQVIKLTPVPGSQAFFDRWTGACTGTGACTVTMTAPRSVNASFTAAANLTISLSGSGMGTGFVRANGVPCTEECVEKYRAGTIVTLTTVVPTGILFDGWGGDCAGRGRNASCTLTMSGNRSVGAAFGRRPHRVTVAAAAVPGAAVREGIGQVQISGLPGPGAVQCAAGNSPCVYEALYQSGLNFFAIPSAGNRFISWTGTGCAGQPSPGCSVTLVSNLSVKALFRAVTALTVLKAGNGQGTITGPGISCGSDCAGEAFTNTSATIRFTPATGTNFVQWEGGACHGVKTTSCTFFATDDVTITARSELRRHRLTVTPRANASVVSTTPMADAIDCGADCISTLDYGSIVGLRAVPEPGLLFTRWTGNAPCSAGPQATNASCVFVLTANVTAAPTYRVGTTVTLVKTGGGQGTVGISGTLNVGVSCAPICAGATVQAFDKQPVKLMATASVGSTFTGFSDACTSPGPSCTFVAAGAAQNVNANFVLQPRTVLVDIRGDGIVTGTSTAPDVVTCDAIGCPVVGLYSQEVTLTATPGMGNRFIGWAGCARANGSVCHVKLVNPTPAPVKVAAIFSFALTVEKLGDGTGTVTGPGIDCGADCVETYTPGTSVILSRTAGPGSGFDAWIGDCDVLANGGCLAIMNGNRHIGATFGGPRTLTVVKTGIGSGTVISNPPGINCGTTCTAVFPYRSTVTVTATPAPGSVVDPIDPSCIAIGDKKACTFMLTVDGPLNVAFNPPGRVAVQIFGVVDRGRVVSDDGQIDCGAGHTACMMRYALGTVVRLTALPEAGTLFTGWGGACATASNASCVVTVTAQTGLSASFADTTPVTIDFRGAGAGRVTVAPDYGQPPCDSPGPCTLLALPFTFVTLTPSASSGVFGEWGGACAGISRDESCVLYVYTNFVVTASFLLDPVTVQVAGTEDLGIRDADRQCNEPCERLFERGSVVTFEAAPRLGRVFTGWGDDCAAFGNASCMLELTDNRTVSASVLVVARTITVEFYPYYYGPGGGEVVLTGSTGSVSCFAPCTMLFPPDETVTIEAFPDGFTVFYGFDFSCDFFTYPCTLTMDRDHFVGVYFDSCGFFCGFGGFGAAPGGAALRASGRRQVHAPDAVRLARRPAVDAGLAAQSRIAAEAIVQPHAGGQQAAVDHDVLARHEA